MEPWINADDVPNAESFAALDLDALCAASSEILHIRSGRQFGTGTTTVRPSHLGPSCSCGGVGIPGSRDVVPYGYGLEDSGYGLATSTACACPGTQELLLRGPNVRDLTVKVDGVALAAPADYRIMNGRLLVRAERLLWPCCQDLSLPDTQPGTFSVRYSWGHTVPPAGTLAAAALTRELGLAVLNDDNCQLPAGTVRVASQGVQAIVQDPLSLLREGLTGIRLVDIFLTTYNPTGQRRPARVISPDTIAQRREAP